jgi:hypothetical protein
LFSNSAALASKKSHAKAMQIIAGTNEKDIHEIRL